MRRRRFDITIVILSSIIALWLAPGREARGDRGEASVHAQVQYGQATTGELQTPGATDTTPFRGVGARATYAISNWYAFEAALGHGWLAGTARYSLDPRIGRERHWNMAWTQASIGITARFGVRFIPVLSATMGMQRRVWQGQEFERDSLYCPPREGVVPPRPCFRVLRDRSTMEPVGSLAVGLDYRLGDHWITGLAVTAQRALVVEAPFQTIAATFHISYYFYPEGAAP